MSRIVSEVNMPKLSGCFGFSRRAIAQRHRRLVHRLRDLREVARLDRQRQLTPRSEHLLELAERDDRELVLRLAEQRALLRADADDAEVHAFDLDDLVERIDVGAEQPVGGLPADAPRPAARVSTSVGLISRPRSASKLEKLT